MECLIGYIKILCAGNAARGARLKCKNSGAIRDIRDYKRLSGTIRGYKGYNGL